MNYAKALAQASLRSRTIKPRKPNTKAGKRRLHFVVGNDTVDLNTIPSTDPVWSLVSFSRLLTEHENTEIEVYKKAGKHGIISAKVIGGPKIRRGYERPLRYSMDEYLAGYHWVSEYLASVGVTFTSSSWASEQVFRMGFTKPLRISNPMGRLLMKTSRGICRPGNTYRGRIEKWDIRSAYPYAMLQNAHRFPTTLVPIEPHEWNQRDDTLSLCHVVSRPSPYETELPILQEHPTDMENPREQVAWLFRFEVETILEHGHYVEPLASFKIVTADLSDEFGKWNDILSPRYEHDIGFAGKILKSIANALWGSFASSMVYAYSWKRDEWGNPTTDQFKRQAYGGMIGGEHVAAWTNALVSDRVFNEFIYPHHVLYFDTDGGFCRPLPDTIGNGEFGQWRYEGEYRKLQVIGWQAYAAWNDNGASVVLSGVPDATLADLRHYGDSKERHDLMSRLIEPDPFNQVAAVSTTHNVITTVPPEVATLSAKHWSPIERDIPPHAAQVNALHVDRVQVEETQAQAFRQLSTFPKIILDTEPAPMVQSPYQHKRTERVLDNGKGQGQLWSGGSHSDPEQQVR